MNEENLDVVEEQPEGIDSFSGNESEDTSFQEEAAEGTEAPAEKQMPQSQVNKLIQYKLLQAEQKAEARLKQREAELMAQQKPSAETAPADDINALMAQLKAEIKSAAAQEVAQLKTQQQDAVISRDFTKRMEAALTDDPEFIDAFQDLNLRPETSGIDAELIRMTTGLDNTAAVLKELGKHPEKYSTVRAFLREDNSRMAQKTLQNISAAIARNDAAAKATPNPKPPGQLKPSNLGIGGGKVTTLDQMKSYFS